MFKLLVNLFYKLSTKKKFQNYFLFILCLFLLSELLAKHYTQVNAHIRKQFIQQLNAYCNKTVLEEAPEEEHQYQWTYYNAFFFALTTLSTIGEQCLLLFSLFYLPIYSKYETIMNNLVILNILKARILVNFLAIFIVLFC